VAIIAPRTLPDWVVLAWGVIWRRKRVPMLETFRARQVEIDSDRVQPRELDGDVIDPGRTLVITVRPSALTVCVPAAGHLWRQHPEGLGQAVPR
jgi:hypothetical protein